MLILHCPRVKLCDVQSDVLILTASSPGQGLLVVVFIFLFFCICCRFPHTGSIYPLRFRFLARLEKVLNIEMRRISTGVFGETVQIISLVYQRKQASKVKTPTWWARTFLLSFSFSSSLSLSLSFSLLGVIFKE